MAVSSYETERGRGREAERPFEIPAKGWGDVLMRVKQQLNDDTVSLMAAGVGLYALLAAFPALASMVSISGLFMSPTGVADQLSALSGVLPDEALDIFQSQLANVAEKQDSTLGIGAAVTLFIALWSARKGMVAVMQACNVAYDENEKRGFVHKLLLSFAFTLGAILYFMITLGVAVGVPVVLEAVFSSEAIVNTLTVLRWPLLWLFVVLGLAVIYRFAPARRSAQWRWVTPGAMIAATLWLVGSIAFALYVRTFGSYGETYGAMGGVVVLLLWLYLTGYTVILGAEINSELEHQTTRDSTVGRTRPMGRRGAYVADTVGESR